MTIVVRNWEKFQHPDVARNKLRAPAWIRLYTSLLSDEDFLSLTEHRRLVFLLLLLEYASARARLPLDTRSLSRRLQVRVTKADLESLNHAGFIDISASNPQADAAQIHTLEEKRQEQELQNQGPKGSKTTRATTDFDPDELERWAEEINTDEVMAEVVQLTQRNVDNGDKQDLYGEETAGDPEQATPSRARDLAAPQGLTVNGKPGAPLLDELLGDLRSRQA